MMTGLTIVLLASLTLFLGSLLFAVVQDWLKTEKLYNRLIMQNLGPSGHHVPNGVQRRFRQAARRPVRVCGTFIL